MKKIGVLVLILCVVFFSAMATFATDVDQDDVIIGSEQTSVSQTCQREDYTVSSKEEVTINDTDKSVDVTLLLETKKTTVPVATGDKAPVLLLVALMALSAVGAIILMRSKKFSKVMAAVLCVAMLLTGFIANPGTAQALNFSDANLEVKFTNEIMQVFKFDQIVDKTAGICSFIYDGGGETVGFTWELGDLAKGKSQEIVYRLKMRDLVDDSLFDKTMNIANSTFDIGSQANKARLPKTTLKVGLNGFTLTYDIGSGIVGSGPAAKNLPAIDDYVLDTTTIPTHYASTDGRDIVFVGWTDSASDANTIFDYGEGALLAAVKVLTVDIVDDDVTVYALWSYDDGDGPTINVDTVTLTFVAGDHGTISGSATVVAYKGADWSTVTIPTITEEDGWDLTSWNPTLPTKVPSTDTTYTAQYTKIASMWFKVTYNGNESTGGTVPTDNTEYLTGTTNVQVLANTGNLVKTGYAFLGWSTNSSAMTATYPVASLPTTMTITDNVTLYAIWQVLPPVVNAFTVSASGAATQAATSSSFEINLDKSDSEQIITLTGSVDGTNLSTDPGLTTWICGGTDYTWGEGDSDSATYTVTIPANTTGAMIVTARPKDDLSKTSIVVTIIVENYTLFYSEGNMMFGSDNNTSTTTTATSTTINLTSPVGAATIRWFTAKNAASTTNSVTSKTWTVTQSGGIGTAGLVASIDDLPFSTVTETAAEYGVLIPANFGTGTVTLMVGDYTIVINIIESRTMSTDIKIGETFESSGIEWRVLAKGTGVNGAGTGNASDALVIAEHVQFDSQIHNSSGNWDTTTRWAGSNLRKALNGTTGLAGMTGTGKADEWYAARATDTAFMRSIVPTDLSTKIGFDGSGGYDNSVTDQEFFLLSEDEVFGISSGGNTANNLYSGVTLMVDTHSRKTTTLASNGIWWTRSPYYGTGNAARVNSSLGGIYRSQVNSSHGIRPACVVNLDYVAPEYTLFYSEGNMLYGWVTNDDTYSTATSFTINLTSPVGAATNRYFTTRNAGNTEDYTNASVLASVTQTNTGGTADASVGTDNVALRTLTIPIGYIGTITLSIGIFTVIINVTENRAKSSSVLVGETFAAAGVEWRVLAKGKGVNGTGTGSYTDALIIAEHALFDARIHESSPANWDINIGWGGSHLRYAMNGISSTTNTELAYAWYNGLDFGFISSVIETTIKTKEAHNGNTGNYISMENQKFFLLSEDEVFRTSEGGDISNNLYVGKTLFADAYSRKATTLASNGNWWLRSPYGGDKATAVNFSTGDVNARDVDALRGIRPACVVDLD